MKTSQSDNIASVTLKYMLQFLGVVLVYGILLYTTLGYWIPFLIQKVSKRYYGPSPLTLNMDILLIVYCLFGYFANNFILKLYRKGQIGKLIISIIIDILLVPLSILLVILYYNAAPKNSIPFITDVYNIYLVTALLVAKVLIFAKFFPNNPAANKA